ncbi:copper resistance protein B [Sphingomonas sp. CFBP 13728]|uniref:copper resistance protein B n=1 Tax=Sphingomonas sp. CFBP 13728 TaxID=2775294 RepID=UPI001780F241|nr:copper resistance protein B [Sphingomonas sp. CFBP 13728]MBD8617311.1 copper resistance protein B [Sphingomonas sp. CFBP 13728]
MKTLLLTVPILLVATPAAAQMHDMAGMKMPGMTMPAKGSAKPDVKPHAKPKAAANARAVVKAKPSGKPKPIPRKTHAEVAKPMAMPGMDMTAPAGPPSSTSAAPLSHACLPEHAAMGHCTPAAPSSEPAPVAPSGTDQAAGDAPPPAPPTTLAAARFYDPATMATANRLMRDEHGGMRLSQVIFNLAEVQVRNGRDGYRWDGEGWFGGDIHRLVVKTEGEGSFADRVDNAEVQLLYSKALDPYWNLQAGVRQDLGAGAKRTYAVVGVEGLAPYWFDVEGTVFLSDKGDVLARGEAWYDQRITQRAILQPRVELNFAAQDMPGSRIGAGLSTAEVGLCLRYEIKREFAPYVGVSWERRYGATARFARADGDDTGGIALALGVRAWF